MSYIHAKQTLSTLQNKDGSYTGFIKVHFQLVRPISLPPRQSLCSSQEEDQRGRRMKRRTSFYLPKDTAKHLHISSRTCVREVIEALLNKFTVVDNPAKFALFERTERHSQGRILNHVQKEKKFFLYGTSLSAEFCFPQCACVNYPPTSVPSTCACVPAPVRRS